MGSMAPADCATPALAVGSNLLRWFWGDRIANVDFVEDKTVQRAL